MQSLYNLHIMQELCIVCASFLQPKIIRKGFAFFMHKTIFQIILRSKIYRQSVQTLDCTPLTNRETSK